MSLYGLYHLVEPALPDHCEPTNEILYRLSSTFHVCVPTNLAFLSTLLGTLSIFSWLCAQLPQIYKNYQIHSTSGLSIFFLGEWLLGDLSNLLGSVFSRQALWQVILASYYCVVDCLLVGQYIWYEYLRHDSASVSSKPIDTPSVKQLRTPEIRGQFRMPRFSGSPSASPSSSSLGSTPTTQTINRITVGTSPAPSPRTILYITLLMAIVAQASPLQTTSRIIHPVPESATAIAGRLLSWMSTFLYLGSRIPQLYKNYTRRSTTGLSPALFIAAFFGNLFYSTSLLTNPCAWDDFEPYGGGGWVGPHGSDHVEWVSRAAPFFLGAAGVLVMDALMGVQFLCYSEERPSPTVVVVEMSKDKRWRWRRVSGYMRGWMPSVSVAATPRPGTPASKVGSASEPEAECLLGSSPRQEDIGYGGV
ncbi:hypothetical protein EJ08DRAFT_591166 [Tothia fuscella]|uniref:PQ loop repeat protein n=1 Tax=Tothia fuscella TaxID=1048955 RepID=A0A9P4NNK4_9PEZI|nr:hypothetical protein EJ08DRAFT_591166 [Tothia fuscella]